jgi:RHS repeat-associated protein
MKTPKQPWQTQNLDVLKIQLDRENPRVEIPAKATQAEIRLLLLQHEDVVDLAKDIIASAGLMAGEQIIVAKEGGKHVVLEGNLSTCACQLLVKPSLIPNEYKGKFPSVGSTDLKNRLKTIPSAIAPNRDAAGNIRHLADLDGDIVASYDYEPFGRLTAENGPAADASPFRFSSKYYDAETGLYYYGHRASAPAAMKWLSRDPLGERGGINLTAFCGNDPVNAVDPLGLAPTTIKSIVIDLKTGEQDTTYEPDIAARYKNYNVPEEWMYTVPRLPPGNYVIMDDPWKEFCEIGEGSLSFGFFPKVQQNIQLGPLKGKIEIGYENSIDAKYTGGTYKETTSEQWAIGVGIKKGKKTVFGGEYSYARSTLGLPDLEYYGPFCRQDYNEFGLPVTVKEYKRESNREKRGSSYKMMFFP